MIAKVEYLVGQAHDTESLSQILQHRGMASLEELSYATALDIHLIQIELEKLVQAGKVELLRPVGASSQIAPSHEYYRWRNTEDRLHVWHMTLRTEKKDLLLLRPTLLASLFG